MCFNFACLSYSFYELDYAMNIVLVVNITYLLLDQAPSIL